LFSAVPGYDLCTGWGTPCGTNLIKALLDPPVDALRISPPLGQAFVAPVGSTSNFTSQTFVLTNTGPTPLQWALSTSAGWLTSSQDNGTLLPGGPATEVSVTFLFTNTSLVLGTLSADLWITNLNSGAAQNRSFNLSIGNGGFETGDFSDWQLTGDTNVNFADSIDFALLSGSSSIPGVDDAKFAHTGIYGAFLGQANSPGSLSQSIPTVPGQQYLVSFWLANPASGVPNEFGVSWNESLLFHQLNLDAFDWTNLQFIVTATATESALEFSFRNDNKAFGLDDITLHIVPPLVLRIFRQENGTIALSWETLDGFGYQVQYTPSLELAAWTNLGAPISPSGESTVTILDPALLSSQRFYRVLRSP
jgi:hypothetical protein